MNEPIAPNNPQPWSDRRRVGLLVLLTLLVHAFMVANTTVVSRDCLVFSRYAMSLEESPRDLRDPNKYLQAPWEVIQKSEHPPAYPACILCISWLVRPFLGTTPQALTLSAQLVSMLSAVLLVFPMFGLVRRLFDRNIALAATAIYQFLPVFMEVTIDGISDGLYLLTVAGTLWFATRALEMSFSYGAYAYGVGAGLCVGLSYLIRPDSMIIGVAVGLTYAGSLFARRFVVSMRGQARLPFWAGVGLVLGISIIFWPYVQLIGGFTNKPSGREMLVRLQALLGLSDAEPQSTYFQRESRLNAVDIPLAAWWNPQIHAGQSRKMWAAKELFIKEFPKAAHYALPFFGLLGLWFWRAHLRDARYAMLVMVAVIHMTILWVLASGVGYVSQRHTLTTVMITAIFGAASFPVLGRLCLRGQIGRDWRWGIVFVVLIIGSSLPRDFRSLHSERAGHKAAGLWLAEHGEPTIGIVDPFGWTEFYAGRTLRDWSRSSPYVGPWVYSIVEPNGKSPHSRLPNFPESRRLAEQGTKIYQYPEDASPEKVLVAVYRCKPLKHP